MNEDKSALRRKRWMSMFIVVIMVLSVVGFTINDLFGESYEYNGFKFTQTEKGYVIKISGEKIAFNYFPSQLESIEIPSNAIALLMNSKTVSISYDPQSYLVETMAGMQFYLEQVMPELFGVAVQKGMTNSTGYSLPEINCENATESVPVIVFREGNESAFVFEDSCLVIEAARTDELAMNVERLVYGLAGIIE